jgi:hypothetical protein
MMKRTNHYRDRSRAKHRIIALLICAALVLSAVAIGVLATASTGFAATDSAVTGQDEPGGGSDTAAAAEDEPVDPPDPVYIEIVEYPRNMNVGDKSTIEYDLRNAEPDAIVKWNTSDDDIASVGSDGTVRALAVCKVEITASLGAAKASVLISVTEKIIEPKSFKVEIRESTGGDVLLTTYDVKRGDELHMDVKVNPEDATLKGKFKWTASKSGVVTITEKGEVNETATLKAERPGEVTLTVSYVDENRDKSKRVELDDRTIVLRVEEKAEPEPESELDLMTMVLIVFVVIVVVIILILIGVASGRKRRRAEEERRERIAKKQREEARREKAKREERARLRDEGYERGYRDSEAEQFERLTRVYDVPEPPPAPSAPPAPPVPPPVSPTAAPVDDEVEPEKPFSVDDIE